MSFPTSASRSIGLCLLMSTALLVGCAPLSLPRIDPSGNRLFLPGSASYSGPSRATPAYQAPPNPYPCPYPVPMAPSGAPNATGVPYPVRPTPNPRPLPNNYGQVNVPPAGVPIRPAPVAQSPVPRVLPAAPEVTIPRKSGRIILTPDEVVAPVGSEVVVLAGLCGNDGHYVIGQPVEWMLSQESVGNLVSVADGPYKLISGVFGRESRKLSTGFAKGTTSNQEKRVTRGTPTPGDDIRVAKGQTWVSLTSSAEGTSMLTCMAPKANGWDRRRSTAKVHWLDARWQLPQDATLTNGTTQNLAVKLTRSNNEPISNWKVIFEIVGGRNAGLLPSGGQKAEVTTNGLGEASVGIRQLQNGPGLARVRIQIIRPGNPFGSQRQLTVVDQTRTIRWTAPALAIEVAGPNNVGRDAEFTYRVSVKNPGDAVARNAVVRMTGIDPKLEILSAKPEGKVIGGTMEWRMGDIAPNQMPYSIDIKFKAFRAGKTSTCFTVESVEDQLAPVKACMDTNVAVPCIGLKINGPTDAKVGETLTYKLRIENQCEQPISGIRLIANYDDGLNFPGRTSPIEQALGEQLNFGYYKELEISFVATKPGRQCFTIDVSSSDGSKARIQQCVQVASVPRPSAEISVNGPALGQVGDVKRYVIDVKNNGNVPLTNVEVAIAFDRAFIPENATDGFRQRGDDELFWPIGRLEPGQVIPLGVDHRLTRETQNALNIVKISSKEGVLVKDQVRTVIRPATPAVNPPNPVGNPNLSNSLKVRGLVLTNPVNPNDNAELTVEVLNDRPPQDFEPNVVVTVRAPNELQLISNIQGMTKQVGATETTYQLQPINALRGSRPQSIKLSFKPTQPDGTYKVIVGARSDRANLVEQTVEINVTK